MKHHLLGRGLSYQKVFSYVFDNNTSDVHFPSPKTPTPSRRFSGECGTGLVVVKRLFGFDSEKHLRESDLTPERCGIGIE